MFGWREVHRVGTHMENTQLAQGAVLGSAKGGFFFFFFNFVVRLKTGFQSLTGNCVALLQPYKLQFNYVLSRQTEHQFANSLCN